MKKLSLRLASMSMLSLMASGALAQGMAQTYEVTVTNTMANELIAPILTTATHHDEAIFKGDYVTPEAEVQVLTGDPAKLAAKIGEDVTIAHGEDGPPGVLLAPGKSLTFTVTTEAKEIRLFAMVAPTEKPDNYLTTTIALEPGMEKAMAEETMAKDTMAKDTMAKDTMAKDTMAKDTMAKDDMMTDSMMKDGMISAVLHRFDIGHDEKTMMTTPVAGEFGTVTVKKL